MNVKCRTLVVLFALFLLAVLGVPALANPGLSVTGVLWQSEVVPGNSYTHQITIRTDTTDPAMDILVDVRGLGQTLEGATQALEAAEDTSPYSARSFITVDKSSVHIERGGSQEVVATLQLPPGVTAGGRYAIIYIHTQPMGAGQVGIVTAVNVPVYLTIKGSQLIHEGKIAGLVTNEAVTGEPLEILTNFRNTGNHNFKVKGEDTIKDTQGNILYKISIPVTASVLPSMTRQIKATFTPQGNLPPGSYSVQSRIMLEDGTVLDEATANFEIKAPGVSPLAPSVSPRATPPAEAKTPLPTAPQPPLPPAPKPTAVNWPLYGGLIAGVIIIILLIVLIIKRRSY
jgi:hypothetical protein